MTIIGATRTHMSSPGDEEVSKIRESFVANVRQEEASARMSCELFVLSKHQGDGEEGNTKATAYHAIQQYDLDVVPLKEEDAPHINFCIWVDPASKLAMYVPMSSRVQLSNGKPCNVEQYKMYVDRRQLNEDDKAEIQERLTELEPDADSTNKDNAVDGNSYKKKGVSSALSSDDDEDDSDHETSFMNSSKPIVAEDG
jgi:hypothetical protein